MFGLECSSVGFDKYICVFYSIFLLNDISIKLFRIGGYECYRLMLMTLFRGPFFFDSKKIRLFELKKIHLEVHKEKT